MNQHALVSKFSHVKPGDTHYTGGGLRDFFLYRDLGIADATGGQVICHLVKANPDLPPEDGTGWHRHDCDFQIVIMMKGWARFMYEDKPTLVSAGDGQPGGFQDRRRAAGDRQGPAGDALEVIGQCRRRRN